MVLSKVNNDCYDFNGAISVDCNISYVSFIYIMF